MKITIVYDNEIRKVGLRQGWEFSALVEDAEAPPLLFDTGADGPALLHNMQELNIDPRDISIIVISHAHGDHTGGLSEILSINRIAELYLPSSFKSAFPGRKVTMVKDPIQIRENIFSTGELAEVEQSLVFKIARGIFVLTGCAHPGVKSILDTATKFGKLYGIAGGLHGFHNFEAFYDLSVICPCHCTTYKHEIRNLFGDKFLECGAGLAIEL